MKLEAQSAKSANSAQFTAESQPLAEVAINAALKSAIEDPINGIGQVVNQISNRDLVPELHITRHIDVLEEPEFNSAPWYAQNFGAAVGMIPAFLLVRKGVRTAMSGTGAAASIVESSVSGAVYDGLLRPVHNDAPFLRARLENAAIGGLTFGSMEVAGLGISKLGRSVVAEALPLKPNYLVTTGLKAASSGAFGGAVNAESSSLMHEGRAATRKEVWRSAYTFAIVGAGLSAFDAAVKSPEKTAIDARDSILDSRSVDGPIRKTRDSISEVLAGGNMQIVSGKLAEVEALLGKRQELSGIDQQVKHDSWDHAGVIVAKLTGRGGTTIEAMVRTLQSSNPFDIFKFERSQQAAVMHDLMGFEHGIPQVAERTITVVPTEAKAADTASKVTPKPEHRTIWLEQKAGENIEDGMRRMAREKYGEKNDTDEHVVQLLNEHPALKERLEDAILERMLNGDLDLTAGNMVFERSGSTPTDPAPIQNIDHAQSFTPVEAASWSSNSAFWITDSLRRVFGEKPLSAKNQLRVSSFLQQYSTVEGQAVAVQRSGLHPDQVSAYVARAKDLLTNGYPKVLEMMDPKYDELYVAQTDASRTWFKQHPPKHKLSPKEQQ